MDFCKIKEMYELGFSVKRIAFDLGYKPTIIKNFINENNLTIKIEKFSEDKISDIIKLYTSGVSAKNIGIKYKIDKRRVFKWIKKEHPIRSFSEANRLIKFNENIFDNINSKEKAYWLGFLYANAYNSKNTNTLIVSLSYQDHDHLKKLSSFVGLQDSKIKLSNSKHPTSTLKMYSKHLCNTLNKLGCSQEKRFTITYPEFLSSNLNNYFIRGLFDGGGSINMAVKTNEWRFNLVSTKECLDVIKQIIYEETGVLTQHHNISSTSNNTYTIYVNGNDQVLPIMNWLYSSEPVLSRKYNKYCELKNQQSNIKINQSNYVDNQIKFNILNKSNTEIVKKHHVNRSTVDRVKNNKNNSFINKYSWKCLLGSMSHSYEINNNLAIWKVGKNKVVTHIAALDILTDLDIDYIKNNLGCSFHYFDQYNLDILYENFKINKRNLESTCLDITNLNYIGRKNHGIRGAINKNKKLNFTIEKNFRNIKDVEDMINEWSTILAQKYWQDHSGKNLFFFNNNFHKDCLNNFIYDKDKLIAFSVLSPEIKSSYIIGKALTHIYPGLAEYADDIAYKDALQHGVKEVNLGQSVGGVGVFKNKFPGAKVIPHFDGKIRLIK